MSNLEDFDKEIECFYKEERYAVRDNGAVLRYPIDGKKKASYRQQLDFWKVKLKVRLFRNCCCKNSQNSGYCFSWRTTHKRTCCRSY